MSCSCVKFIHLVEQSKSEKASLIRWSCTKAEEQTFNLIKVGISSLSNVSQTSKNCRKFFPLSVFWFRWDHSIHPFPHQKEKITEEIISSSMEKLP